MKGFDSLKRRLDVLASDRGREGGWYVMRGRERIAALADCVPVDMFIESYRIELLVDESALDFGSESFWTDEPLAFVSREFDVVAPHAVVLAYRPGEPPRLELRGLYLSDPPQRPWETPLVRWWRKRRAGEGSRKTQTAGGPR